MGHLELRPISLRDANAFVERLHRHNGKVAGHRFAVSCWDDGRLCGVAICGNPIARKLDDGMTIEIRRLCTDGTRNACSILYAACQRAARALGYKRVITYTLESEGGASLRAAGFVIDAENCGGTSWDMPSRPREVVQETLFGVERKYPDELKTRWVKEWT